MSLCIFQGTGSLVILPHGQFILNYYEFPSLTAILFFFLYLHIPNLQLWSSIKRCKRGPRD